MPQAGCDTRNACVPQAKLTQRPKADGTQNPFPPERGEEVLPERAGTMAEPMSPLLPFATLAMIAGSPQVPNPFKNICIAKPGQGGMQPCEPSIAINPKNTKNIVAGVILDTAIWTLDGGATWTPVRLKSQYGVFGDPTLIADQQGNFHFFHLSSGKTQESWLDRIVSQKSTNGGQTWSDGAGIGYNGTADQDKQWAATHPSKPIVVTTWTEFDLYGSKLPNKHSKINFSISTDAGENWSKAQTISDIWGDCLDDDGTTEGAVPAIGVDGTIYVAWSLNEIIFFDKSTDNGKTWLAHDYPICRMVGGWNMDVPGVNRTNGMPVLMTDNSNGPFKGSLYCVYADQSAGALDTDIFLIRSRDKGETWTKPMRINQDEPGKHNFLPWLAVDPTSGFLYIVYYDRRNYNDEQTDVYLASSTNGGQSFQERKISESPFKPVSGRFLGDYNNISAQGGVITPIWTRMDNGNTSVWTAVIKQSSLD